MNVPNAITLLRLVVTVGVFWCLERADRAAPEVGAADAELLWWAFGLFLFAAVTDFFDGWVARRFDQVSMFGRILDPFADKVLICGTLVFLVSFGALRELIPTWFVVVVLARELLVTTLRGAVESRGKAFPAERLGKWKMVAQCATASSAISLLAGSNIFYEVVQYGMWVTLGLTVFSGLGYVWRARALLAG